MKELSIEEKAKAYDEALERAKEMIKAMTNIGGVAKVDDIQYIFQLNESEDEKIKKCISDVIKEYNREHNWSHIFGVTKDDCLAWLEKQGETFSKKDVDDAYLKGVCDAKHELEKQGEKGTNGNEREIPNSEQKPADKVEPKFKVGCVIQQIKPHDNIPLRVVYIGAGSYQCESDDLKIRYSFPIKEQDDWELIEQKPAEWSAEDEEKVKAMCEDGNLKPSERAWLKSLKDRVQLQNTFYNNGRINIEVWVTKNKQWILKLNGKVVRGQWGDEPQCIYKQFFYLNELVSTGSKKKKY